MKQTQYELGQLSYSILEAATIIQNYNALIIAFNSSNLHYQIEFYLLK